MAVAEKTSPHASHGKGEQETTWYGIIQQVLKRNKDCRGEKHPAYAISLNNLATVYFAQGQYGKAESLYERTLAILEKVLGPEHPKLAEGLNNLALLYNKQGRYAEADALKALAAL